MALRGHVFDKQLFSSDCYALVTDTFLGKQSGIIRGCDMTNTSSLIYINEGYFIVKGRPLQEEGGSNIEVEPGNIDGSYCKLVCELDMSKNNTTTELNQVSYKIVEDVTNYPVLTQEDITNKGTIYQFEFAKFRRTLNGIEDFVDTRSFLNFDSIYEEIRNEIKKIEEGSIFVTEEEMREVGVAVSPTQPETNEKVWIQKGKNRLKLEETTQTVNGVTITINSDGSITLNGTATDNTSFIFSKKIIKDVGDFAFGITTDFSAIGHDFEVGGYVYGADGQYKYNISTNQPTKTLSDGEYISNFNIYFSSGAVFNNFVIYPQLEQGSTATEYEAYVNRKINVDNEKFLDVETMGIETITNENGTAIKFPDGTMICRGIFSIPANTGNITISYPLSFIDEGYSILFTNIYSYSTRIIYSVGGTPSNNITVYAATDGGETPSLQCDALYTAIGRWKN